MVKLDAERASAKAAEARKRKTEIEAAKEPPVTKKGFKKNNFKNDKAARKTVGKAAAPKPAKQGQRVPKEAVDGKNVVGGPGANGYKAAQGAGIDHCPKRTNETLREDAVYGDRSDEHVLVGCVGGENVKGNSEDVAVDKAGPTEPGSNERSAAKMEMDQEDSTHNSHPDGYLPIQIGSGANATEHPHGIASDMAGLEDTPYNGVPDAEIEIDHEDDIRDDISVGKSTAYETADEEGFPDGDGSMEDIRDGHNN